MFSLFFELVQYRYVNWADEFHTLRCRVVRHDNIDVHMMSARPLSAGSNLVVHDINELAGKENITYTRNQNTFNEDKKH